MARSSSLPGLAGLETTLVLHDARRIGSPSATWGVLEGNPVHDDVRAIARATGVHFACDVVLNRRHEIVAAFAGELFAMHRAATARAREVAMQVVPHRFDVVVTSNAGFPLDQNLYQAVKGMSAAFEVVQPGGLIVVAAECRDGFPDHGEFRDLLYSMRSPQQLLDMLSDRTRDGPGPMGSADPRPSLVRRTGRRACRRAHIRRTVPRFTFRCRRYRRDGSR